MSGRNYFIPSLIILILFLVICIVVFIRKRELSIFLTLIPPIVAVVSYSPLVRGNSKAETAMLVLTVIIGSIVYGLNFKERRWQELNNKFISIQCRVYSEL